MLVSSIARFNAVNTMHNAAFASMSLANSRGSLANNAGSFGGEHDLAMLHNADKRISLDLISNNLLYKMAYLQEKLAKKRLASREYSAEQND
jgi:hypothetical protein